MRAIKVVAGLAVALLGTRTHADTTIATSDPPRPASPLLSDLRLAGGIGARFGSFLIDGQSTGTMDAIHLDAGVRTPRVFLYADYDLFGVAVPGALAARGGTAGDVSGGLVQRIGGNARYAFGHVGDHSADADVWAEAGAGMQLIRWDGGGALTRPDLAFGVGTSFVGKNKHMHAGTSIGFRVLIARRLPSSMGPTCAGPCDVATSPPGWDRSISFDLTFLFGR